MDVWHITVAALRRWYVLLPLLGVTALMVIAAGEGVQPEYDVTGTTMVVPGRTVPNFPNPYGAPDDANTAVVIVLNSPETRARIAEQGFIASYEVAPQSRSTIMNFEVRGASPADAVETGIAVFQLAATELRDRQTAARIPLNQQYTIDVLQTPSVAAAVTDGKLRNMAVVGVLGGAISLAVAVFFDDAVGLWRRRRRRARQGRAATEADEPEGSIPSEAAVADAGTPSGAAETAGDTTLRTRPPTRATNTVLAVRRPELPAGQSRSPRMPKQSRKAKKAANVASDSGATNVSRGSALSDAP